MALTDNLEAYWKLDESSGTLADATGNGVTMTSHNSPTYSASGKINSALSFAAASSQYLDATHNAALNAASYTVCAWIKRASNPTECYILTHDGDATNHGWAAGLYQNRIMLLHGSVALVQGASSITDTNWHHYAYTYSGGTVSFYLDGATDGTGSAGAYTAVSTSVVIGANKDASGNPKAYFDGTLDEVGYWSRALSGAEITSLYNSGSGLAYPFSTFLPRQQYFIRQAVNRASTY